MTTCDDVATTIVPGDAEKDFAMPIPMATDDNARRFMLVVPAS